MDDLPSRLRALKIMDEVGSDNSLGRDAADEIERLRAELLVVKSERDRLLGEVEIYRADIDKRKLPFTKRAAK